MNRLDVVRHACPGPGACGGMYTANTMASAIETLGMSRRREPPLPATVPEPIPYHPRYPNPRHVCAVLVLDPCLGAGCQRGEGRAAPGEGAREISRDASRSAQIGPD